MFSFKRDLVYLKDRVFTMLKQTIKFLSCFIDTDILWMSNHLLLIVLLISKLYFVVSYFGDFCLFRI